MIGTLLQHSLLFTITTPNATPGTGGFVDEVSITLTRRTPLSTWCGDVSIRGFAVQDLSNGGMIFPTETWDLSDLLSGDVFLENDDGNTLFPFNEESVTYTYDFSEFMMPLNEYKIVCWYRLHNIKPVGAFFIVPFGGGNNIIFPAYNPIPTISNEMGPNYLSIDVGDKFHIYGSTNNDGVYTVSGLSNLGAIEVEESLTAGLDDQYWITFQSASFFDYSTYGAHEVFGYTEGGILELISAVNEGTYIETSEAFVPSADGYYNGVEIMNVGDRFIGETITIDWNSVFVNSEN